MPRFAAACPALRGSAAGLLSVLGAMTGAGILTGAVGSATRADTTLRFTAHDQPPVLVVAVPEHTPAPGAEPDGPDHSLRSYGLDLFNPPGLFSADSTPGTEVLLAVDAPLAAQPTGFGVETTVPVPGTVAVLGFGALLAARRKR